MSALLELTREMMIQYDSLQHGQNSLLILLGKWSPEPNVSQVAMFCAALDLEMSTLHGQSERD